MANNPSSPTQPSLLDALLPIIILVCMLAGTVYVFGLDAFGPNQLALLLSAALAALIGIKNGMTWHAVEEGMIDTIRMSLRAVLILLMVGALIGSWILSGTVPTMIYFGVELMSAQYFYVSACLVCAMVGFSIGSSWTVAGTLGVGLISIATALDLPLSISAGAIISGAYMGDKMSPLSDTTNLAAAVTRNDLFHHIQHMTWTTIPAFAIALIVFTVLGLGGDQNVTIEQIAQLQLALDSNFTINIAMLIPLFLLLGMAVKRLPALATLICGTLAGVVFALIFQNHQVLLQGAGQEQQLGHVAQLFKGLFSTLYNGYSADSGLAMLDTLLSKGGMSSMLTTVGLIICALAFGGAMSRAGLLQRLVDGALSRVKSKAGLIGTTVGSCVGTNVLAADQYLSIVVPGQMFEDAYRQRGLQSINLSRTLEDSGTLTSALIPWNTCGAYMTAALGVSTFHYAPFALLNILCPILAIMYGIFQFKLPAIESAKS